jgi:hypothetical protein
LPSGTPITSTYEMGRPPIGRVAMTASQRQMRHIAKLRKLAAPRRALSPSQNGPAHDLVSTPPKLARAIVQHYRPDGACLDPSRGRGAFWRALKAAPAVTEVLWCEIEAGRDFFAFNERVDWIITNPPWSKMRRFLRHAMAISDHVVFLATLNHFQTTARFQDIATAGFGLREALLLDHPPPPWPRSGFQLAAVHIWRVPSSLLLASGR